MMKRGFTLIEALAVVSIIGILASLTIYTFNSVTARSRDARRKSDLVAISLGFQARYDAQTCTNATDIGHYPGVKFNPTSWRKVSDLNNIPDDCGAFSEYLATIPVNPNDPTHHLPYQFNLSNESDGTIGKHYRLTAHLEKNLSGQEKADLARIMFVWKGSFGGKPLPLGYAGQDYDYVVGK